MLPRLGGGQCGADGFGGVGHRAKPRRGRAQQNGLISLYEDGLDKVWQGATSLEDFIVKTALAQGEVAGHDLASAARFNLRRYADGKPLRNQIDMAALGFV